MKNILFPTAYSAHSKAAYRYAQKLAFFFDASITLAHIYYSPLPVFDEDSEMDENSLRNIQNIGDKEWDEQMDKLKAFAKEMNDNQYKNIPLDYIITDGDAFKELIKISKQDNFDLIVMGMRKHDLAGKLFGNITYDMIEKVSCPLLLIPPDTKYKGISNIIYGTAFELGDEKSIEHLFDWCFAFEAHLTLTHVFKHDEDHPEAYRKIKEQKNKYKDEIDAGVLSFKLEQGEIKNTLMNCIEKDNIQILAIHHRKRGFWQKIKESSLSTQMAEIVNLPLLILK